jgi:hypothetical protein
MLIHAEAFALAFAGCAATNLDNIMLVLASGRSAGARRAALTFLVTLVSVIVLAMLLSLGVDLVMPRFFAWVGLVPLGMGLYELWPHRSVEPSLTGVGKLSIMSLALPLAANSLDTLLVQTILFSDLAAGYHPAALSGATAAAVLLAMAAFVILSRHSRVDRLLALAGRLRPWILIAVGALIFMDTGFDTQ